MAQILTDQKLSKLSDLLANKTPRSYWDVGQILQAALTDTTPGPDGKMQSAYGTGWMVSLVKRLKQPGRHPKSERALYQCREFFRRWNETEISAVERSQLTLRNALNLLQFDKAVSRLPDDARRKRITQARRQFLNDYRKAPRDFYAKFRQLTWVCLHRTQPGQATPVARWEYLRRSFVITRDRLVKQAAMANALLDPANRKQAAKGLRHVKSLCGGLLDRYTAAKVRVAAKSAP